MTQPVGLYGGMFPKFPLVFLARLYMSKFHLRDHMVIHCGQISVCQHQLSSIFVAAGSLQRTEAVRCLHVSQISHQRVWNGPTWRDPLATSSFISLVIQHWATSLATRQICTYSNCLFAACLSDRLILVFSYESSLKRVGVHGEKQHSWWEGSEFLTQFVHWYWTPLLQQSLPCGLFSLLHKQFPWWQNMQTSGYLKAACRGQCSFFVYCLPLVLQLSSATKFLSRTQAL